MLKAFLVSMVASGAVFMALANTSAQRAEAQQVVICVGLSNGNYYSYGGSLSCPISGALGDSSFLHKYDPYFYDYYVIDSTFSGCACFYDAAFDSHSGGSGSYYTQTYHTANLPGYTPGAGISYHVFTA